MTTTGVYPRETVLGTDNEARLPTVDLETVLGVVLHPLNWDRKPKSKYLREYRDSLGPPDTPLGSVIRLVVFVVAIGNFFWLLASPYLSLSNKNL